MNPNTNARRPVNENENSPVPTNVPYRRLDEKDTSPPVASDRKK
jgi:hypothetical protein